MTTKRSARTIHCTQHQKDYMDQAAQHTRDADAALANVAHYLALAGVGTMGTEAQYHAAGALQKRVCLLKKRIQLKTEGCVASI